MKKQVMKYAATLLLLFAFILAAPAKGQSVEAAAPKDVAKSRTINVLYSVQEGESYYTFFEYLTMESGWKITKVSCKNKKIATATKLNDEEHGPAIFLKIKKAGSTTVKFTLKKGSRSYSYTWSLKVSKYTNPFKTFKIGSKSYVSKFNNTCTSILQTKVSGKFTYTLKSGWKVQKIRKYTEPDKNVAVKKNQKITLNKGEGLILWMKNTKTGTVSIFELGVY